MARRAPWLVLALLVACARSEDASTLAESNELPAVEEVRIPGLDDDDPHDDVRR